MSPCAGLLALMALLASIGAAHSQPTAYKCTINGKASYQDTPCESAPGKPLPLVAPSLSDERAAAAKQRESLEATIERACATKNAKLCDDAKQIRKTADQLDRINRERETAPLEDMQAANRRANARINYRVAREDYLRASAAVDTSLPSAAFSAALAARSAAHDRMLSARSAYFKEYGRYPDD